MAFGDVNGLISIAINCKIFPRQDILYLPFWKMKLRKPRKPEQSITIQMTQVASFLLTQARLAS